MDRATKAALCGHRLERARDDLETAILNLTAGKWRAAVNRAYYAMFHTASAALVWHEREQARHSGVQSAFGSVLVNPGLIETEYGRMLAHARRERDSQDYQFPPSPLTEGQARQTVADAERFVARMERYLREVGALDDTPKE